MLLCNGAASDTCLTEGELATARAFYAGPTGRDGKPAYFGWLQGSEMPGTFGWSFLQKPINGQPPFGALFQWVCGPDWDWRRFDVDRDMPIVDARLDPIVNDAMRGSLEAFAARGGKLIVFHGLADTLVPPGQSVAFFDRHAEQMGGVAKLADSARLFLIPGMMHCGGGTGPMGFNTALGIPQRPPCDDAQHDMFSAPIAWTEGGRRPPGSLPHYIPTKMGKALRCSVRFAHIPSGWSIEARDQSRRRAASAAKSRRSEETIYDRPIRLRTVRLDARTRAGTIRSQGSD